MIKNFASSILFLCCVTLISGCNDRDRRRSIHPDASVRNIGVKFYSDATDKDKEEILEAVEYTLNFFEADYGAQTVPTVIVVFDLPTLTDGSRTYTGLFTWPENIIDVTAGEYNQLPALYHELWHANRHDFDHSVENWDFINSTGNMIQSQIAQRRIIYVELSD